MSIIHLAKRIYFSPLTEKIIISLENRNSSGVYALICKVNNKIYIGSSVKLSDRLLDYMQPAYLTKQANRPILRAIEKYGILNWTFIILETCHVSNVLAREQYWLDLLFPNYNLCRTAGSTLGVSLSEEAKAKLSAYRKGKTHSEETRQLMSESRKGSNNPMFGLHHNEITKAKLSAALKGSLSPSYGVARSPEIIALMRANHPLTKQVYQYTSDRITLIAQFDSIREAAKLTGISRSYLSLCIKQGKLAHDKWLFSLTAPA